MFEDIAQNVADASGLGIGIRELQQRATADGRTVGSMVVEATQGLVKQATAIGDALAPKVTLTISSATDSGQMAAGMNSLFDLADVHASLVARSANFFANALGTQAALTVHPDQAMNKTWITMGDDRVRPDHMDVDDQTMPVDQPFTVGGESLMYPGDPNGSDAEVANCRCWLVFESASGQEVGQSESINASASSTDALTASDTDAVPSHPWMLTRSPFAERPPRNRAERRAAERHKPRRTKGRR